jgi:hypothetical protein
MFGDIAAELLKLMGHSGTVPSALRAEDVPAALDRLKAGIEADKAESATDASAEEADRESEEEAVSLALRAVPLIELLKKASKAKCNVMWDS